MSKEKSNRMGLGEPQAYWCRRNYINPRYVIEANGIIDMVKDPTHRLTWEELCDLLNELYYKNQILKLMNNQQADKLAEIAEILAREVEI